jgi:hypothetical protein
MGCYLSHLSHHDPPSIAIGGLLAAVSSGLGRWPLGMLWAFGMIRISGCS